jgi:hypothetical protein
MSPSSSPTNLRLSTVQYPDDAQIYSGTQQINDELIDWLRANLPSTYSIVRAESLRNIRVWIQRIRLLGGGSWGFPLANFFLCYSFLPRNFTNT